MTVKKTQMFPEFSQNPKKRVAENVVFSLVCTFGLFVKNKVKLDCFM